MTSLLMLAVRVALLKRGKRRTMRAKKTDLSCMARALVLGRWWNASSEKMVGQTRDSGREATEADRF